MLVFRRLPVLRWVLLADAIISGATGLLMVLGAEVFTYLLELPIGLLRAAGLILLPYGLVVAYVATRNRLHQSAVWVVITINTLWAVDSIVLLLSGWVAPTALSYAVVIAQAVVVAVFVQYTAIRRTTTTV